MRAARAPFRSALSSYFRCTTVSAFPIVQTRGYRKKWPADQVQLFVNEYKHSNPIENAAYTMRRLRYAKLGLVAPRANDYDSDSYTLSEEIKDMIPKITKNGELPKIFHEDFEELYKEYRREQEIAKDDPRSPFYFEDETEAKEAAIRFAMDGAFGRLQRREMDDVRETVDNVNKHKIMSDVQPPVHEGILSSYIPEPDPVNYSQWELYTPEFPLTFNVNQDKESTVLPMTPPRAREPQLKEDGSAVARGARKNAVAIATIRRGTGKIVVNDKPLVEYFRMIDARDRVLHPFLISETLYSFDASITVRGGGIKGQAGACAHALARALENFDPNFRLVLRNAGLLTRDPRMVERKKPGKPKARKAFQWVKR